MNLIYKVWITVIVLLLGAAGVILVNRFSNNKPVVEESNSIVGIEEATSTEGIAGEITQSNTPQYPSYTGESITFLGNDPIIKAFPTEAVAKQRLFLSQLAISLKENPYNFDDWMAVGTHKKFFNNYNGARDAWEYAKYFSDNPISYLNLASLYGYYLHDLPKAEENYLLAIDHDSLNAVGSLYAAASFFRDFGMKDKAIEYYKNILEMDPKDAAVKVELERLEASK